jgi:hypothetical protein
VRNAIIVDALHGAHLNLPRVYNRYISSYDVDHRATCFHFDFYKCGSASVDTKGQESRATKCDVHEDFLSINDFR